MNGRTRAFLVWWRDNLVESLPASLRRRWHDLRDRHDFILVHIGDEVLVRNRRGDLVEQVSLIEADFPLEPSMDTELDIDLGGSVVPLASRRTADTQAVEMTETMGLPEDSTARVIELSSHRGEITQLLDEEGQLQQDALENTQLFFFQNGEVQPVKTGEAAEAHPDIDFELLGQDLEQQKRDRLRTLIGKYLRKGRCLYLISPERLLSLRLSYSSKARDRIDAVLRYDLEKHMPLGLDEIRYFHATGPDAQQDKVRVDVEVMKRPDHAALIEDIGDLVSKGLQVSTVNLHRNHRCTIELDPDIRRSLPSRLFNRDTLVWGLNLLLLLALLALPFWWLQEQARTTSRVSPERLAQAGEIQALKRSLERQATTDEALIREAGRYPRVLPLLSRLSESIGDQAWLHDLQLEGDRLRIKGEAESASAVSDDLYRSEAFDEIRFISSIVKNAASGKEAFEIGMKVKTDE